MRSIDIRDFGADPTGRKLSTDAIRAAIAAAGMDDTILFPAGRFLSFSIPLKSHIHLHLSQGCVLEAADPAVHDGAYDAAEPNAYDLYQDFGHSHWRNSLIYGIDVEGVGIGGTGIIDGRGLTREGPGSQWRKRAGEFPLSMRGLSAAQLAELSPEVSAMKGLGNKAIAFCRAEGINLREFTVLNGGHFAVLATGVNGLRIENLFIDTNRDGIDIDGCERVVVRGCKVNTPNDDAIVLKSSYALGELRDTQDVVIEDCQVSGYDPGSLYTGTKGRSQEKAPDQDRVTGRIKIGTESNGDFRRIRIANCTFERSRGLALETVDGGTIENVVVSNLRMTEVTTAPIFLRLGARLRGPDGAKPGNMRNIRISNIVATDILGDYSALIMGLPDHPIENVRFKNIHLTYRGGGRKEDAHRAHEELADAYPEPSMFGPTPAYGLWARHVTGLTFDHLSFDIETPDARPETLLDDVQLG